MGGRDTGSLYSGLMAPVRREQLDEKKKESHLDAKAEMVLDEIAKQKAEAMDISRIVLDETITDDVRLAQIKRMKDRYLDLATLERRMQKLLGVKK